jgi:hypothetical protein
MMNATFVDGYEFATFEVLPLFEYESLCDYEDFLPDYILCGDDFTTTLTLTNPFDTPITNINVNLKIPLNVQSYETQEVLLDEEFSDTVPPLGWETDFWKKSYTNEAGGTIPEACVYKYDQYSGYQYYDNYIMTPGIDASDYDIIVLEFKFAADTYYPQYCNFHVKYRNDVDSSWEDITPWSNPLSEDFNGSYKIAINCEEGFGDYFQVKWEYNGYYYYYDYFYLDDVVIKGGTLSRHIEELPPGSFETLTWDLYARSSTAVAPFEYIITSDNGGNIDLSANKEIFPISIDEQIENPLGPIALLYPSKTTVKKGEEVTFDGSDSIGVDLDYFFDFGDGENTSWTSDSIVNHEYQKQGTYYARLKVRDAYGGESFWTTVEMTVPKYKSTASEILSVPFFNYLKNSLILYSMLNNLPRL